MKTKLLFLSRSVCTIFLTFTLLLCFAATGFAATYYISPTGNDATGNGSIANPWKTLLKATQSVTSPGNIIHVLAGTYTETQTCNLAVGVSIEGDGITSILKSNVSADWTPLLRCNSNSEGTDGNQHISNLKFDGQNLKTFWGIEIVGRKNFSIYNCTIVDFNDRGVIFAGRIDNANAAPNTYATGNSFHDNIMTNCARYTPGYGAGCLNIGGQRGMLVYKNTISQNSRTPGNNGWPIKYWNDGYLDDCKIYDNVLNKIMNHSFLGNGCWDFAIELFNVRGLEIHHNTMNGGGIDLNYQDKGPYAYSTWIHHNLIQMPSINTYLQTAVTLEFQSETVLIEDNVFDKVNIGVNYTPRPGDAVTDNTIRRNLMTNIGKAEGTGFFITFGGSGGSGLTFNNLNIYNNTMIMSSSNPTWWGIDLPNVGSGSVSNINIKNNIINGAASGVITQYSRVGTNTLNISNNDLYGNGNGNAPVFTNVPAPANYTYTNNMLGVNPMFVGGGNYTLQAISPLIDVGIYVGLPYSGIAPDRGYAEFGSITLPITLIDFTAKENSGKNVLNWNTASESNSSYFSIERSDNGSTFYSIGRVNASGFSAVEVKYDFTDANPLAGVNYYRLAMVDKDGSLEYSKIVSLTNKISHSLAITQVNLSASSNTAMVMISSTKTQTANLSIFDVSGRIILNSQISLQNGNNTITKNLPAITKGIYYVKLFTAEETVVKNSLTQN
jgi:hypothetical protein